MPAADKKLPSPALQGLPGLLRPPLLVMVLLLLAAGALAYGNSLRVPFQFDDLPNITLNPDNHMVKMDGESLRRAVKGPNHRRPLAYLSFALNYYLGRNDPLGYHLVNLLVHLANGLLVFLLGLGILEAMGGEGGSQKAEAGEGPRWTAFGAALLFLVHPVQTQAVTYIVQRMTSLSALFMLIATLAWISARRSPRNRGGWIAGGLLAWAAACFTKENAFILPLVLLGMDALLYDDIARFARERRPRFLLVLLALGALLAGAGLYLEPEFEAVYRTRPFSPAERLLTQPRVIFHYLSLLAWPLPGRFHLDYDFPVSTGLLSPPTTLPAILGIFGLIGAGWMLRRRAPLFSLAVLWFFGNITVESSIVPLEMVFEHRIYVPSVGVFLLLSAALWKAFGKRRPIAFLLLLALSGTLLILATRARNEVWSDPARLFGESAAHSPGKARAHLNVGWSHYYAGRMDEAEKAFRKVLELEPGNAAALNNLGNVARSRGRLDEAVRWYREAVRQNPGLVDPRLSLAAIEIGRGRMKAALKELEAILRIDPRNAKAHSNLGTVYGMLGDKAEARRHYDLAVRYDPGEPGAYTTRARFLISIKLFEAARRDLETARRIAPGDPENLFQIGVAHEEMGLPEAALKDYEEALEQRPDLPNANFRIGNILAFRGELDRAGKYFLRETAIRPHSEALNNLGNIAWQRGDLETAADYYRKAIKVDPKNAAARRNLENIRKASSRG